jgi:hypothetical protein
MRGIKALTIAICGLITTGSGAVTAKPIGIFAMFGQGAGKVQLHESATGCTITRQGDIVKRQGNLDLPEVARFAILGCENEQLGQKGYAEELFVEADPLILVEGGLKALSGQAPAADVGQRSYIIKLSHYNNADPQARDADFKAIGKAVAPLDEKYHPELFVAVRRAVGMQTPDELAVIYYDSPEAGSRFRETNQAILEMVGAFNKSHMKSFVYLYAKVD